MGFNPLRGFRAIQPNSNLTPFRHPTKGFSSGSESWGGQALVDRPILAGKVGRVKFRNSWWSARSEQTVNIAEGEVVDVVGLEGITLWVEPAFLLKPSRQGLIKILQACETKDWFETCPPDLIAQLDQGTPQETWRRFIQGKPVYIDAFKLCCRLLELDWQKIAGYSNRSPVPPVVLSVSEEPSEIEIDFIGRSGVITELQRLTQTGAKVTVILGEGGIGKTTVARQFFQQSTFDVVLECWLAKESHNLTPAESIVQEWLQRHFQEQPADNFRLSLERLRQQLQQRSVGVLIDNLESALDRDGQWIEAHRNYVALLEVLADPTVKSVTLITSREPLHERTVTVQPYILPHLDVAAWEQFFSCRYILANPSILQQMHRVYRGNAKAMRILSSVVSLDYHSSLEAYWHDHQANWLQETDLQDLVNSHFERVQQLYPEAYQLLCRLGCYRFQEIATVPLEGLICLMWDVPEGQHFRMIRFLRDLFLVEWCEGSYRLHPMVQAKAVTLLKASPHWITANRHAALFWTTRVKTIETLEDALIALEAYYHCVQIGEIEAAARVILHRRDSKWEKQETLGVAAYRLGLLQRMTTIIGHIIDRVQPGYALSKLHNILGDVYWLMGLVHQAIDSHQKSREVAIAFQIKNLEIVALFNIGLCKLDLWELEEATNYFNQVNLLAEHTEFHMYAVGSWFCLAFLYSCFEHRKIARQYVQKVLQEVETFDTTGWGRGYSLLFLGLTLTNLRAFDQADEMYALAQDYAEQSCYVQVKARALNGVAVIQREQEQLQAAFTNHLAARNLLEQIGAKADLAEVYYQLGITQQHMNKLEESQMSFEIAIDLFIKMGAPRQVEKVKQAFHE